MLDEYLNSQLRLIEKEYFELNKKLQDLNEQETSEQEEIAALIGKDDVGIEIFSPRARENSVKTKIEDIQKHIEELQLMQAETSEEIARNREKAEKYQILLNQSLEKEETQKRILSNENIVYDNLSEILRRVDLCLNLIGHDRNKCKNELKNLRGYIKTLITDLENDMQEK